MSTHEKKDKPDEKEAAPKGAKEKGTHGTISFTVPEMVPEADAIKLIHDLGDVVEKALKERMGKNAPPVEVKP